MLLQDGGDGDVGAVPGYQRGGAAQRVRGAHEQHHDHHQRGTVYNNFNIDAHRLQNIWREHSAVHLRKSSQMGFLV